VNIPTIVDGTVGFGDAIHTVRAMWELESAGAAGVEFGDQITPKRAHHHKGVDYLVEPEVFAGKIEEAVRARQDPGFVVIARTGAARWEDLDAAIARGHLYAEAGADALLLADVEEADWPRVRAAFSVPLVLMGNHTRHQASTMGAALVLDASTLQLAALKAIRESLEGAMRGDQQDLTAVRPLRDDASGIEQLWDIESRTTEQALYR
jgi:methylisocitrate lyase